MQDKPNDSFLANAANPFIQAGVLLGCIIILMLLMKVAMMTGAADFKPSMPWIISASFILFYTVFNALFSLSSDDMNKYWMRSIAAYFVLAISAAGLSYIVAPFAPEEGGNIRWIFIVLTFVYLVFLSMLNFMKQIVTFAEREEWNAPKKRSNNKKSNNRNRRR